MKFLTFLLPVLAFPAILNAQIGLKAGLNFTNVSNVKSVNNKSSSGFNAGIFYASPYGKILGSKTELVFSRQGYDYETGAVTGKVNLDYLMLPTYLCINITRYFQIQLGMQFGYLLSANADSANKSNAAYSGEVNNAVAFYNRFSYSAGGGVEVHPYKGILIGARLNVSLSNLYKTPDPATTNAQPSFIPEVNIKSNLLQIYAGWRFGH